jgi:hypothetical protein
MDKITVVFGSSQYCGLGRTFWQQYSRATYSRIQHLIGHLRSKRLARKLIRNQLEYTYL